MDLPSEPGNYGSAPIDEMLQDALRVVRIRLGMDVAFISEIADGRRTFTHVDASPEFAPLRVGDSDPVEQSLCQFVVTGRLPELIHDAREIAEARVLPAITRLPVGAHLSVPVKVDGEIYGTFCCFSREGDTSIDGRDLTLVRSFAELVGRLIGGRVRERRQLEAKYRRIWSALDEQLFYMAYQPIFYLRSRRLAGHEALTRFTGHPARPPDHWFNEAAKVGLQAELELAVIRKSLEDFHRFDDGTYLSFNISPQTLIDLPDLDVFEGFPLERIMLELTEHSWVTDYGAVAECLAGLRSRGLLLAVDDAGAGYASFRHILKLRPDVIKLDASLVSAIDTDLGMRALAAALVKFAEKTNSQVVAEGVETEQELEALRRLKVDKAQGYLLGRPSPLDPPAGSPGVHSAQMLRTGT